MLAAGEYYEYDIPGVEGDPHYIYTSEIAYVYHVSGLTADPGSENGMAQVAPIGECRGDDSIEFVRFAGGGDHAVHIIIENIGLADLTLNGQPDPVSSL